MIVVCCIPRPAQNLKVVVVAVVVANVAVVVAVVVVAVWVHPYTLIQNHQA